MANPKTDSPRRVGDYNPDVESGDVLDPIEGKEVLIASIYQETRSGRNGPYTLTIVTLEDGSLYHTGSPVVAERLGNVPSEGFPVLATFERVKSTNDPTRSYWNVR